MKKSDLYFPLRQGDLSIVSFMSRYYKTLWVYIRHYYKFQTLNHKQMRVCCVRNLVTIITKIKIYALKTSQY